MAYRGKGIRGGRGRAFMVNNGNGIDNFGNQNHFRNEIEELSIQIATLNDKVQLLMMKRRVATLTKKVHRLLPHGGIHDSHSQIKSSFDFNEENNIADDLVKSYGPFDLDEFEEKMILTLSVFEEVKELGCINGFPIFDEYPSEGLECVIEDGCVFEIEDECEDLPIFDESRNEDFVGDLEGVPVYDEYTNEDDISGDLDDVPIYDKFEEEFSVDIDEGKLVNVIKESFVRPIKKARKHKERMKKVCYQSQKRLFLMSRLF